jgi:hypothetical protein
LVLVGLLICLVVAGGLSLLASTAPDGLESVAETVGFADTARDPSTAGSPLADYQVGTTAAPWSRSLAGVAGVLLTGAVAAGVFLVVGGRRR